MQLEYKGDLMVGFICLTGCIACTLSMIFKYKKMEIASIVSLCYSCAALGFSFCDILLRFWRG